MKTRTLTIGCLLVLLTLLGVGIVVIQTQTTEPIGVTVRLTPFMISEEDPPPEDFRVTISNLPAPYKPEDIVAETVKVEGIISIKPVPDWPKVQKSFFAFKVDGTELVNSIWPKIWHMAPEPGTKVDVTITVTGQFYDETAFEGTCDMTFMTLHPQGNPIP